MKAFERLIRYAQIHTSSAEGKEATPSTSCQFNLSHLLETEMRELGFENVYTDEHAYVYGSLPATAGKEHEPCIALIAHLDTIPDSDFSGLNVKPELIEQYDGRDLPLGDSGRILSPAVFPELKELVGHTLIVTDGNTVLGADDKAGIAEILTACEELLAEKLPHGRIAVCFPPDEEIGHGAALLDLHRLGADFAFTVDGGAPEELSYETFNAASATVEVHGVNVHPGSAKGKMKNASLIAMEFNALLPAAERPEFTEEREGFFHLTAISGNVEKASMRYIIRDHNAERFSGRKENLYQAAKFLNERYGSGTISLQIEEQYRNMEEILHSRMEIVERAKAAIQEAGLTPKCVPVRGGTDGSQLSFRGLPCPNLGTGGAGFHGPYEHISVQRMNLVVQILKNLLTQ